jgi:hypothetical protein
MVRALAMLALVACSDNRAPTPPAPAADPAGLATYLDTIAAYPPAARAAEMAHWKLDRAAWNRIVVEPFRGAYDAYDAGFADAIAPEVGKLHAGVIATRRHYSGEPKNTVAESWLRWALPTLYPSAVAELEGAPIDLVFVHDGAGWRTLAGLDHIIVERGRAFDPACTAYLEGVAQKACSEVGYLIAAAAIRSDRTAFDRACRLAASRCGNRSE